MSNIDNEDVYRAEVDPESNQIVRATIIETIANNTSSINNSDIPIDTDYVAKIISTDIIEALGYVPYDSSNPDGYTTNRGTVTSINNESPDETGNININTDKYYTHTQGIATSSWSIQHNLGKYPSIIVVDTAGEVQMPNSITYINESNIIVNFLSAFAGTAYLN